MDRLTTNYVFGVGLECETTFTFYDKSRTKTSWVSRSVKNVNKFRLDDLPYHVNSAHWNKKSGWEKRTNQKSGDIVGVSGDSTVIGAPRYGIEFGTTKMASLGVKPKDMIVHYQKAVVEFADNIKGYVGSNDADYVRKTPFASPITYDAGGEGGPGSWHVNITMPYDITKMSSSTYIKNYNDKLFNGIKVVRAIQPLILAMVGGADYKSVGSPSWAEGSSRQAYVGYGNLGNVILDSDFRRGLDSPGFRYKHVRTGSNKYRQKVKKLLDSSEVVNTNVGDIAQKDYNNVHPKITTIEYRFLDTFHVPVMYDIMKVIVSALEHGNNISGITDAGQSDSWQEAAARIVVEGWNARLPKEYSLMLKNKLGLNIPVKEDMRADLLFEAVSKELWSKNKSGEWVKVLFDEFSYPKVMNLNRLNWEAQFRFKYVKDSSFRTYINKFIATLLKMDTSKSNGWISVDYKDNKYSIRDILIDDDRGLDFASEDFEDLLHLLDRIKAIKLDVNDTGQIKRIKVVNTDVKDVMDDINNLKDLDSDILLEASTPEPEPEPRTRTTTITPYNRVSVSTPQNTTINSELLDIRTYIDRDYANSYYNRRDLEEIFNLSNFVYDGERNFNVSVFSAKIKYNGRALESFWVKNNDRVRVFIDDDILEHEETPLDVINKIKPNFYSHISITETNVFTNTLTIDEFFRRLKNVANNHFSKRPQKITLDRTGIEKLRKEGLVIVSYMRGVMYYIADRSKWSKLSRKYGGDVKIVKYIPYQKNVSVQKNNIGDYRLMMKGKVIDEIRR